MAIFAKQIPELHRIVRIDPFGIADFRGAIGKIFVVLLRRSPCHRHPRKIAFHIRHKDRNAVARKAFGHHLQRDGFARSGSARNQPVPVCPLPIDGLTCAFGCRTDKKAFFGH